MEFFRHFLFIMSVFLLVALIGGLITFSLVWPMIVAEHNGYEAPNWPTWVGIAMFASPIFMISVLYALAQYFKLFDFK